MLITRGFDKLAGAETLILLHRLEALTRAMRQTLRREFQTCIVKLRLRHRHRAAVELHRNIGGAQCVGEFGGVLVGQIGEIGRASGRERVCQYVSISVVAVSFKKKKIQTIQQLKINYKTELN